EVFRDVPLGAAADPPGVPVHVAAWCRNSHTGYDRAVTPADASAKHGVGAIVVADGGIAAVQRGAPARIPEVLIGRVDAPCRRQLDISGLPERVVKKAAKDAIRERTKGHELPINLAPVRVRGLEDVAQGALGVGGLSLEVVALANHWCVHLHAAADCKAEHI